MYWKQSRASGQRSRSHCVSAVVCYKSEMDRMTEFRLVEYYPSVECNMWHMSKIIRSNSEIIITERNT